MSPIEGNGWTVKTLQIYQEALRHADEKFFDERDRRYGEVKEAEEKALKIKERADEVALGLQRETQQYKDEKANELRSQIEREQGERATKVELQASVERLRAEGRGHSVDTRTVVLAVIGLILTGIIAFSTFKGQPTSAKTQVIERVVTR